MIDVSGLGLGVYRGSIAKTIGPRQHYIDFGKVGQHAVVLKVPQQRLRGRYVKPGSCQKLIVHAIEIVAASGCELAGHAGNGILSSSMFCYFSFFSRYFLLLSLLIAADRIILHSRTGRWLVCHGKLGRRSATTAHCWLS